MAIIKREHNAHDKTFFRVMYNNKDMANFEYICDTAEEAASVANMLTLKYLQEKIFNAPVTDNKENLLINFTDIYSSIDDVEDLLTIFTAEKILDELRDAGDAGNELIYIEVV